MVAAPHNERHAMGLGLAAVLLWSTVATAFKLGLAVLTVTQLLWLGTLMSWAVFACAALGGRRWRLAAGERWLAVAFGLLNPCCYYLVLFAAYDRLPAHIAQPLNYTWAITLALLAVPILGQRLSRMRLIGILISYAGVVLLLSAGPTDGDEAWSLPGIGLALGSTILWALYWLLNTRTVSDPVAVMFWSFSAALPAVGLVCVLDSGWPALTAQTLAAGAWVGCIEMGFTFLLWQGALRRTRQAGRLGQLIFLSPFVSLIIIHQVLGESIHATAIAGLVVIVAGLWIGARQPADGAVSAP